MNQIITAYDVSCDNLIVPKTDGANYVFSLLMRNSLLPEVNSGKQSC